MLFRSRVTKSVPALDYDEIAIGVKLEVPDAYFSRPYPVVKVIVPDPVDNPAPEVVVDITANTVAKALNLTVDSVRDGLKEMMNEAESSLSNPG